MEELDLQLRIIQENEDCSFNQGSNKGSVGVKSRYDTSQIDKQYLDIKIACERETQGIVQWDNNLTETIKSYKVIDNDYEYIQNQIKLTHAQIQKVAFSK